MDKGQEKQIVDYYSTKDRYIKSDIHSNTHQTVYTKENDKYQWLVLEQKSRNSVEVRQTDRHGKNTAWDNYDVTGSMPKCTSVERLNEDGYSHSQFSADEINLIYQFGEQDRAGTCKSLSVILPDIKDKGTVKLISATIDKLNAISETVCMELTATTKRRKIAERDHSIRERLAKAKNLLKEPAVAGEKADKKQKRGKGEMDL